MENNEEKINKLLNFADDSGLAIFDELQEVNESLKDFNNTFKDVDLSNVDILKGEQGDQGEPGKDGRDGIDGKDGKDGLNGEQGKDGVPGKDGIDGLDGLDGKDGVDGKDAITLNQTPFEKAAEMVDAINDWLPKEPKYQIDASHIKNLLRYMPRYVGSGGTNSGVTGVGSSLFDSNRPTTRAGIPVVTANGNTVQEFLEAYFFPPNRPTVVLNTSPAGGIREAGNAVTSVDLTPTTNAGAFPITTLTLSGTTGFFFSYPTPNPAGATEATQTDSTGFVVDTTYTAVVGDGTNTGSDTVTFSFVFPYYKGVGVVNLSGIGTNGGSLTKVVAGNPFTLSLAYTTVNQVPYLAFPASYGKLKKVLDVNGFDVSPDWGTQAGGPNTNIDPWSTINITNSFGVVVSCYVYQFKNLTTTNMTYTFSQ